MTDLPDVNVLVAVAWPNHVHHGAALRWFSDARSRGWATCPVTESGFVRVSSNRRVIRDARSITEAVDVLRQLRDVGVHRFVDDDTSLATTPHVDVAQLQGYRQVTDAHLLALARSRGLRLVTADAGLADLGGESTLRLGL